MIIGIDTMGGDNAPKAQIKGAIDYLRENENDKIVFYGNELKINQFFKEYMIKKENKNIEIVNCTENIENNDEPVKAMKKKVDSPMVKAALDLKNKKIDAFISSGATGGLFVTSLFKLGRISGVERPALTIIYPKANGPCVMLDVGANSECKKEHIDKFAFMGSLYAKAVLNVKEPSVGLINIGEEEKKGSKLYIETYGMLKENKNIKFIGNVEGRDIPYNKADVLVCDGFTGNIVLKLTEGLAINLGKMIKKNIMSSLKSKIGGLLIKDSVKKIKKDLDYEEYGGGILLGVKGIVIKAHGSSNEKAFKNAINQAKKVYDNKIIENIELMYKAK